MIRNAVSLGGDTDTVACIAGGIADAFYGVSSVLDEECRKCLPKEWADILRRFDEAKVFAGTYRDLFLKGNERIEENRGVS